MRFFKYLEKYPSETIADTVGVKPATVKRWRRKGEIPDRYKDSVRSVKTKKIANAARMRKTLRDTDVGILSSLTGQSRKTVQKWKMSGEIPLENRMFLVDSFAEPREKPFRMPKPVVERKSTKNFRFSEVGFDFEKELTDSTLVEILRGISKWRMPKDASVTVRFTGSAVLEPHDRLIKYLEVPYRQRERHEPKEFKFYGEGGSLRTKEAILASAHKKLSSVMNRDMTLMGMTLLVKQRKK